MKFEKFQMKMNRNFLLTISAVLVFWSAFFIAPNKAFATDVDGIINTDTTWNLAGSPYIVQSSVGLGAGGHLVIEPGVIVKFKSNAQLITGGGKITAVGTASQRIIFTAYTDDSAGGDSNGDGSSSGSTSYWTKISLANSNDTFGYAEFRFGTRCVEKTIALEIKNSKFQSCSVGIYSNGNTITVENDEFLNNTTAAVYITSSSSGTIKSNTLNGNAVGIEIQTAGAAGVNITENDIINGTYGIETVVSYSGQISNNNIYGNSTAGLKNFIGGTEVSAENNWWGNSTGPFHATDNSTGTGDTVIGLVDFDPWLNALFTATPPVRSSPNPISGGFKRRPVLIIPGIMGSELYDENGELIWPNVGKILSSASDDFLSEALELDQNGTSINSIDAKKIVELIDFKVSKTNIFESLIKDIKASDPNMYFVFPYDWRLDLDETKELLNTNIKEIKKETGFEKIDIVAHSMGGLLIKDYIDAYNSKSINKIIFVGTPHLGAPKAAYGILQGDLGVPLRALNYKAIRDISMNSPSAYELLPNDLYNQITEGYLRNPDSNFLTYNQTKAYLAGQGKNSFMIHRADDFLNKNLHAMIFPGVEVYNIAGCGTATQALYYLDKSGNITNINYLNGDGTVPLASANYLLTDKANKYYVKNGKHSELPSMEGARNLITDILNGYVYVSPNVSKDTAFCGLLGKKLTWRSPVDVHIYDEQGNHSGPIEEGFENNIPGVSYDIIDEEKFIFLPTGNSEEYRVEGIATDNGTFDLLISNQEDESISKTILYNDVKIVLGSKVALNISMESDDSTISYDYSGTGAYNLTTTDISSDEDAAFAKATGDGKVLGIEYIPDGTLVLDTKDNRTVYMIGNDGKKYGFTSAAAFLGQGFSFENLIKSDLSQHELGGLVSDPNQAHPNGSLITDGQTIRLIKEDKWIGIPDMETFRSQGLDVKNVVKINNADLLFKEKFN